VETTEFKQGHSYYFGGRIRPIVSTEPSAQRQQVHFRHEHA